jgi:drug/metabolite transporter (DMT)-like permease
MHRQLWRKPLHCIANAVIVGIGILCLPQILIFFGNGRLSPVISLVALATVPVLLAISGRLTITAAVCGLAGVLFLEDYGLDISILQLPWLLLPLAAACVLAWALANGEKTMRELSIGEALFAQCAVSALLLSVVSQLLEHQTITWSATAAMGFVVKAVFITVGGYLLFYWLLGRYGAGRVSTLQWTQLLVATAESAVLMSIRPNWTLVAGAILIVIAVVWAFSNRDDDGGVLFEITQS